MARPKPPSILKEKLETQILGNIFWWQRAGNQFEMPRSSVRTRSTHLCADLASSGHDTL